MERYYELLKHARKALDDCRVETCRNLLVTAQTRRTTFKIDAALSEVDLIADLDEIEQDYPVPPGVRRKPGSLGCGSAECDSCYTEPLRPRLYAAWRVRAHGASDLMFI